MAHDKIYGICENKCRHEVYQKSDVDKKFLKKSDAQSSYANLNHASTNTKYGIGTLNNYGHVKITTSLEVTPYETQGIALAASAGNELNSKIKELMESLQELAVTVTILQTEVDDLKNAQ